MIDTILRDSKLPFYHQLYEILRQNIVRGEWQPDDMLPSEIELMERYNVSRITVRQALDELVNEGLIYRQRGRGTFVAHPTVDQALTRIISFTEDMRQRGFTPGTEVLFSGLEPALPEVAEKLQLDPGTELVRLDRLRLADNEPMSIEESHLVHRYCPGILQHDYAANPLREVLEQHYGIRLVRAKQIIRAIAAPRKIADKLSIPANTPLLYIERISYSPQNIPIEFLRLYHRGDRYVLYNELRD
ncbi:MAG: GntR family transcriptional regulator [Anaerolineales bacterium]|nr:GntR family transcriptional regulator [Anaerolineales bacterium]